MNGLILLAGERFRRRSSFAAGEVAGRQREDAELVAAGRHSARARHEKSPGLWGKSRGSLGDRYLSGLQNDGGRPGVTPIGGSPKPAAMVGAPGRTG
jgi:hypothetical protein